MWGGEFGRTPTSQGADGRDHNVGRLHDVDGRRRRQGRPPRTAPPTSTARTAVENQMHHHDLHATMLHLLGLDHQRLTYRYGGRDYSLTDIHGRVVKEMIA